MIRKFLALSVTLGLCAMMAACQARRDIEDDQASGDDRSVTLVVVEPAGGSART